MPTCRLTRRLLLTAVLATAAAVATGATAVSPLAFERPFPPQAKRGTMKPDLFPSIVIDGKPRLMAASARIWNADNLIQMPASLPIRNVVVNYTENDSFEIERVWILSEQEAAQSPEQQKINPKK